MAVANEQGKVTLPKVFRSDDFLTDATASKI
jgi:hypothetical protein